MQFSADQALEANLEGDPIIIDERFASQLCREHSVEFLQFLIDNPTAAQSNTIDAWRVLEWLGY